ncbi:MAG: hypothetical protein ACLPYZ_08115 [Limisphaerales bacterium]
MKVLIRNGKVDQSRTLDFKHVLVRGEVVVSNNQLLEGDQPGGACLCRN